MPSPRRVLVNPTRVEELLRVVSEEEVLPWFGHLQTQDVERKQTEGDADDLVCRVDKAVETRLSRELQRLLPGSVVVGEEACHANPRLLDALTEDGPAWVVDPIDGTQAFVRGEDKFGVMVALLVHRELQAAFVALPVAKQLFVAEAGGGTFCNGERVHLQALPRPAVPRGTLYTKFMPEPLRSTVQRKAEGHYQQRQASGSAAVEYTSILKGEKEFVVYHRLLPWDHLPGVLLIREALGSVRLVSGEDLSPLHRTGPLIVGRDRATEQLVRSWCTST